MTAPVCTRHKRLTEVIGGKKGVQGIRGGMLDGAVRVSYPCRGMGQSPKIDKLNDFLQGKSFPLHSSSRTITVTGSIQIL